MGFEDAGFPALYFRAADAAAPSLLMEDGLMNTSLLLMAQYGGKAVIPIEELCRDWSGCRLDILPRAGDPSSLISQPRPYSGKLILSLAHVKQAGPRLDG